jgi:acyl-CoA thioesterase II
MNQLLADLLKMLTLERLERDLFRGESRDIGSAQVFGGQVLGQALIAATETVDGRVAHSFHAYFLRRGDFNLPIVYEVDRARDGQHFSTRRVVAIQNGEPIFNMSASFQSPEEGLDHQISAPAVPPPEELPAFNPQDLNLPASLPERVRRRILSPRPFEFRPVPNPGAGSMRTPLPVRNIWFRAVDRLPEVESLHRCLLAYVSDYNLLDTALLPHGVTPFSGKLIIASIDHALWFHRPLRVDEWMLYATDGPSASGARGFARGNVYSRNGILVASVAQEGLIRLVKPK